MLTEIIQYGVNPTQRNRKKAFHALDSYFDLTSSEKKRIEELVQNPDNIPNKITIKEFYEQLNLSRNAEKFISVLEKLRVCNPAYSLDYKVPSELVEIAKHKMSQLHANLMADYMQVYNSDTPHEFLNSPRMKYLTFKKMLKSFVVSFFSLGQLILVTDKDKIYKQAQKEIYDFIPQVIKNEIPDKIIRDYLFREIYKNIKYHLLEKFDTLSENMMAQLTSFEDNLKRVR